ncbi:MAG TPA: lysophospholipase [Vitreimonas sp.]|jgi:alpha-beta hydrolase superfamily lysophospholipase|nr:lysophospholipase [Vitreimonas sp.]
MPEAIAEPWDIGRDVAGFVWRTPGAHANVLLAHGFAEYSGRYVRHYSALIPRLNSCGFDVYAFDLKGHGHSTGARGVVDLKAAVRDHQAARRLLDAQKRPLFLFGHSLGGLVTAASVTGEPSGVAGVILSAPALLIQAPPHLRALAGVFAAIAPGLRLAPPIEAASLSRIPEEVAAYTSDPMVSDPRVPAKTGATAIAVAEAAWKRYPDWSAPTLVLHGEKDRATDPQGSKRFIAAIRSADKHLELYPEGLHELLNDLDQKAALALILSWLAERAPVRAGARATG